jgi:hypothetical protein
MLLLPLNCDPPNLSLPSSWNHRHAASVAPSFYCGGVNMIKVHYIYAYEDSIIKPTKYCLKNGVGEGGTCSTT